MAKARKVRSSRFGNPTSALEGLDRALEAANGQASGGSRKLSWDNVHGIGRCVINPGPKLIGEFLNDRAKKLGVGLVDQARLQRPAVCSLAADTIVPILKGQYNSSQPPASYMRKPGDLLEHALRRGGNLVGREADSPVTLHLPHLQMDMRLLPSRGRGSQPTRMLYSVALWGEPGGATEGERILKHEIGLLREASGVGPINDETHRFSVEIAQYLRSVDQDTSVMGEIMRDTDTLPIPAVQLGSLCLLKKTWD